MSAWRTLVALVAVTTGTAVACEDGRTPRDAATGPTAPAPSAPQASSTPTPGPVPDVDPAPPGDPVVLAAGDIASCTSSGDEETAALVDARPEAVVVTLGDNVYDHGTAREFAACYEPSWGRSRSRTRPSPGNHDYGTAGAAGYFGYFGPAAGNPADGYYSYEVGRWHVVSLNSNCTAVPCRPGSAQERWLRADLAASASRCTLAYWHHPRFSSGRVHGSSDAVAPLWQALYDAGADVVLAGHEHHYERLAPLDPAGDPDEARGIRSFVVGTGGRSRYPFGPPIAGSEIRDRSTFGVLSLTLGDDRYEWAFLPSAGGTFTDEGTGRCH
jgi:hypothetical protein